MAARRKKQPVPTEQPPVVEQATGATELTQATPPAAPVEQTGPAPKENDGSRRQWQPDPLPIMAISLGDEKGSPRMRLFRSNRLNQMAIRFDEKPAEQYREQLRESGWRWREDEGVWTRQLDRDRRATSHLEAERLFTQLGDAIRADLGLAGRADVGE